MHYKAKEWDENKPKALPENRPCDWCGKPVDKGYIHEECIKEERDHWLDILY